MASNSRGRKSGAGGASDDGPGHRIHDVRREYKRKRFNQKRLHDFEEADIEEIEDLDELESIENDELDALEESMEPDQEAQR